jgi:hypothetical protein
MPWVRGKDRRKKIAFHHSNQNSVLVITYSSIHSARNSVEFLFALVLLSK